MRGGDEGFSIEMELWTRETCYRNHAEVVADGGARSKGRTGSRRIAEVVIFEGSTSKIRLGTKL